MSSFKHPNEKQRESLKARSDGVLHPKMENTLLVARKKETWQHSGDREWMRA